MIKQLEFSDRQLIEKKIIPLLFYEKSGKGYFKSAKTYFTNNNTSFDEIRSEFQNIGNPQEREFWEVIINALSEIYEHDINKEELLNVLSRTFDDFIRDLLKLRFEYEFSTVDKDGRSVNDMQSFVELLQKEEDSLFIEDDDTTYVFSPSSKKESGNIEPLTPGEFTFYPNILVKIEHKDGKVFFGGGKRERKNFIRNVENECGDILHPETVTLFNEFKLMPRQFFHSLSNLNIYIKGIKINDPYFNLYVSSKKEFIELNTFVNLEFIFYDTEDFLKISEMHFVYLMKINNKLEEIPFKITINKEKQLNSDKVERFFKMNLVITSRKKDLDISEIEKEIVNKLNELKIEINKPYNMPVSYFFKRFINEKGEFRKYYFGIINEVKEDDFVMKELLEKKIIEDSTADVAFEIDEFIKFVKRLISSQLVGKRIVQDKETFELIGVKKEKNNIILRVKLYSDDRENKFTRYYLIRIPLKSRVMSKDKIYHIVLNDLNFYYLIDTIMRAKYEDAVKHIYINLKNYILFQYQFMLEKESYNSYLTIKNYLENIPYYKDMDPKKLGDIMEGHTNVILKYLFANYLIYGGKNRPDGYLNINDQNYIIDCKMHKEIEISEFRKLKDYLDHFTGKENLSETNNGTFIISINLINSHGGSLNPSSKNEVFQDVDYNVGFISLEYILDLYEIYKNNIGRFKKSDLLKILLNTFGKVFNESLNVDNVGKLEESENNIKNDLIRELERNESSYLPSTEKEAM
jgi:hypothetical protein